MQWLRLEWCTQGRTRIKGVDIISFRGPGRSSEVAKPRMALNIRRDGKDKRVHSQADRQIMTIVQLDQSLENLVVDFFRWAIRMNTLGTKLLADANYTPPKSPLSKRIRRDVGPITLMHMNHVSPHFSPRCRKGGA